MPVEVVSDFDGTIVNIDVVEYLLAQFADGDWREYDHQYERGEISLEECLRQQYRMIEEPRKKLLDAVDGVTTFRAGFDGLVAFCRQRGISFTIVSAGLDFVIAHLLRCRNLEKLIVVSAPKSKSTSRGIILDFSGLPQGGSSNFKSGLVKSIQARRTKVAYIGDGFSDYEAIRQANLRFVIRGSRLAEQCRRDDIRCHEITDLGEVTRSLLGHGFDLPGERERRSRRVSTTNVSSNRRSRRAPQGGAHPGLSVRR